VDWHKKAACRGFPTKWWFPEQGGRFDIPVWVCKQCPVKKECLDSALSYPQPVHGIWGGLTERQRVLLKNKQESEMRNGA
tara:strand:+ start:3939 stop:4178 length:240 start_codon:yes stop_codon:yes gene_type:complete